MMDTEKVNIDQLLMNDFSGKITPEEQHTIDCWVGKSIENRHYYNEQKKLWNLFAQHQKMQKIDEKKAFLKISSKLFHKRRFGFLAQLQRVAAILLLPVVLISAIYYFSDKTSRNQFAAVYNTVETPLGMRSSLTLPDGTKVWLNAGSKISYPVLFSDQSREISLSGEAFFEVKKDKKWPFIVKAKDMCVVVTGTSFNCNAYPENEQVQTILVEGEVTIVNQSATELSTMHPGELAIFNNSNQQITKTKADLSKYIAWKSGKLMFRDDKMNQVVEKLERWYNVEFEIHDQEIADYVYTATFIDESLDQVLKMLSLSAPISYTISDRNKMEDQTFEKAKVNLYKKGN
jgi:transmembrane sensor